MLKTIGGAAATLISLGVVSSEAALAATFSLQSASIKDINRVFDQGVLNSEQLVRLYLNRIEAYDDTGPAINSVLTTNPQVLEIAKALDLERQTTGPRSLLHGIPILLKDNHDTFDMPTTGGSDALAGSIPDNDAFVVDLLRDAGAIIFGKAEMDELAISGSGYSSLGGQTYNPYNLLRQSGGSSGGTGAAIAAGFATLGTGSDTGGSIRTPCSFQALVCVRPTRGLLSLDGIIPFVLSRDAIGPMARSVEDVAIALGIMAEFDPNNPTLQTPIAAPPVELDKFYDDYTQFLDKGTLKGAKLGLVTNYIGEENGVDPEVTQLVREALATMKGLGAEVFEISFENDFLATLSGLYGTAIPVEQKVYLEEYLATTGPNYPKTIDDLIAALESPEVAESETPSRILGTLRGSATSEGLTDPDYVEVAEVLTPLVRGTLLDTLDSLSLDAFVFPTIGTFARPVPGVTDPTFVSLPGSPPARQVEFASSVGLPDITVPIGFGTQGLPLTLSMTGRPYSESKLLGLAYSLEQATKARKPPALTPALAGEVFEYTPIPEPEVEMALIALGSALLGYKLLKRSRTTARA
ncbi:amidase family protein [Pseudanabaena sp. FACHB-2040]|uniref:amidase family protein n=1 Tax=Pseudanabaena sp. FACHB-2040 TaxID=2692859 RepID=UPI001685F7B4|nr:amidase family protein [Pseudanabaena sp. FACHB-2040]MBD2258386.1 amidase [Pseudanabaena sp. FACHB-2040]